jgi:hypothetical protein
MEDGTITLVGATTENPSFELNGALLSRAQVLVLHRLDDRALEALLARAEAFEGRPLPIDEDARASLRAMADGDGRYALNLAEELFAVTVAGQAPLDREGLATFVQRRVPLYDKGRDGHYNLISALHKSIRGSDPDAALYWLARMLAGGDGTVDLLGHVEHGTPVAVGHGDHGLARVRVERQRPALLLLGAGEQLGHGRLVEPVEHEHERAGEKRAVELEGGVLGGGADQRDGAVLHVGEEAVLLGSVEAVDLVDEEQRALAGVAYPLGPVEGLA